MKINEYRKRFRKEEIDKLTESCEWSEYAVINIKGAIETFRNWDCGNGSFNGVYMNITSTTVLQKKLPKKPKKPDI